MRRSTNNSSTWMPEPIKSNPKAVEAKVKSIISTVIERCKKESSSNHLMAPLEDYEQRASYYTAFPKTYLWELQDEENKLTVEPKTFITPQRIFIMQCFRDFYMNKTQPTFALLYETVKQFQNMPEFVYFKRELSLIGYEYRVTSNNGLLLAEDPEQRFERYHFLNKILKLRNKNESIYYIDVRVIDNTIKFSKFSHLLNLESYIFLHAISRNGYENGLFCNVLTETTFIKWLTEILIPLLNPGATIVMDRNLLFASPRNKPTKYDSKSTMMQWLKDNNIPFNSDMPKAELFSLIHKDKEYENDFEIRHILRAHGFQVLCLPYKFDDLTPTDLMWKHIQSTLSSSVNCSIMVIKSKIKQTIEQIIRSKWIHWNAIVENWEKEIFEIDQTIENLLDNIEFDTKNNLDNVSTVPSHFYSVQCTCEMR